jgi:hypothetical protein
MLKLLTACLSSMVIFALLGCGDGKSKPRIVDDKDTQQDQKKTDAR